MRIPVIDCVTGKTMIEYSLKAGEAAEKFGDYLCQHLDSLGLICRAWRDN